MTGWGNSADEKSSGGGARCFTDLRGPSNYWKSVTYLRFCFKLMKHSLVIWLPCFVLFSRCEEEHCLQSQPPQDPFCTDFFKAVGGRAKVTNISEHFADCHKPLQIAKLGDLAVIKGATNSTSCFPVGGAGQFGWCNVNRGF